MTVNDKWKSVTEPQPHRKGSNLLLERHEALKLSSHLLKKKKKKLLFHQIEYKTWRYPQKEFFFFF